MQSKLGKAYPKFTDHTQSKNALKWSFLNIFTNPGDDFENLMIHKLTKKRCFLTKKEQRLRETESCWMVGFH